MDNEYYKKVSWNDWSKFFDEHKIVDVTNNVIKILNFYNLEFDLDNGTQNKKYIILKSGDTITEFEDEWILTSMFDEMCICDQYDGLNILLKKYKLI